MRLLTVGAELMQHGWVRCALALRENASHIAEQKHRLSQNRRLLRAQHEYLSVRDQLCAQEQKGHEKGKWD